MLALKRQAKHSAFPSASHSNQYDSFPALKITKALQSPTHFCFTNSSVTSFLISPKTLCFPLGEKKRMSFSQISWQRRFSSKIHPTTLKYLNLSLSQYYPEQSICNLLSISQTAAARRQKKREELSIWSYLRNRVNYGGVKPTFFDHVAFHEDNTKYYYKEAHLGSVLIAAKKKKEVLLLNLEVKTGDFTWITQWETF